MARSKFTIPHPTKLIIDTSNLHAGWIDTPLGRIPVWLEHGGLPKVPRGVLYMTPEGVEAFDASIWICIAEVRNILGLKPYHGEEGEWLACGYIPRSMVEAQVVLHNYQRQKPSSVQSVVKRRGSTRSVSLEEQEEHVKEQIARNKISREDLRSTMSSKKQGHDKSNSLLRKATKNRQVSCALTDHENYSHKTKDAFKQSGGGQASETSLGTSERVLSLRQRATFPKSSAAIEERTGVCEDRARFASIRSAKLREALERNQASRLGKDPKDMGITSKSYPRDKEYKLSKCFSNQEPKSLPLSDNSIKRDKIVLEDCSRMSQPGAIADEDRETIPPSERLRRARAGKKKVKFVESSAKTEPKSKLGDNVEDLFYTVDEGSDATSVISDLARMSFTLPEPPLSSESGSFSDDPPSITDELPPLGGCVFIDEFEALDTQNSAL